MVNTPGAIAVMAPVAASIVAIVVSEATQVPPVIEAEAVVVAPTQSAVIPVKVAGAEGATTLNGSVAAAVPQVPITV